LVQDELIIAPKTKNNIIPKINITGENNNNNKIVFISLVALLTNTLL